MSLLIYQFQGLSVSGHYSNGWGWDNAQAKVKCLRPLLHCLNALTLWCTKTVIYCFLLTWNSCWSLWNVQYLDNSLGPTKIMPISIMKLSASWRHFQQCPLEISSFFLSRKGGIGGGGWVHPMSANSMAVSGLISRNDLGGTGRAISVLLA